MCNLLTLFVWSVIVLQVSAYKKHTALNAIVFTNIDDTQEDISTEYYFGTCATRYKQLVEHHEYGYEDLVGSLMVRGWLNVNSTPECVYIRAKSAYDDTVTYRAYKFTVCLGHIVYYYLWEAEYFYYYEWYIPVEIMKGIEWDLFFYSV